MGGPLPRGDQRTLGFGGAAGMVHPATGYMLTNALRRRDRVARAIAEQLRTWVGPGLPSRVIWRAIWSADELRAWRLYGFGMEVLAGLDRAGIDRFFAEFFDLSDHRWRGFVSATASTPELMGTMLRYFAGAPMPIRRQLAGALLGRSGLRMARGLLGP
jgi:lycopene cyclase-like protein